MNAGSPVRAYTDRVATWEDGPEYAPHEPPAHFAAPETAPLSTADPRPNLSAGAPTRPPRDFAAPSAAPLAQIGTGPGSHARNPAQPFAVAAATMTDGTSAWGAAHSMRNAEPAAEQWAPPQGAPAVATGASGRAGSDSGRDPLRPINLGTAPTATVEQSRWAPPADPVSGSAGPPAPGPHGPGVNGSAPLSAPPSGGVVGSGGWPAPTGAPSATAAPGSARAAVESMVGLLTLPLVVSLLLGLIPPIAPVMLLVSAVLSFRLEPHMVAVRNGIIAGTAYLVFIALLSQLSSDWWGTTTSWAWVVNAFATVYAAAMAHLVARRESRKTSY